MGGWLRAFGRVFSFKGRLRRAPYALATFAVFFVMQVVAAVVMRGQFPTSGIESFLFWTVPEFTFRELESGRIFADLPVEGAAVLTVVAWIRAWILVALAFRRASDARLNAWVVAFVVAPVLQLPLILWLCLAPAREPPEPHQPQTLGDKAARDRAAFQGMAAGVGLTVLAVVLGALVFGVYGYGLFVATPFLIGGISAYLANRRGEIGDGATFKVVAGATTFGALGLLSFALEGVVCLLMALPLAIGAAWIGALFGMAAAKSRRASARSAMMSVAILPALFATERAAPATVMFQQEETVIVSADADATWRAVIHMSPIAERPALPFRLGLAYPLKGEVIGEGVGAIRKGYFSTGIATERVTDWAPGRRLGFDITHDAPSLKELSPYSHVNAPHVEGYFRTSHAAFTLTPLADGRTRMTLKTWHALDLQPAAYWLPFARWAIHANKLRVLTQIERQAEAEAFSRAG